MAKRNRVVLVVFWALSLVAVWQYSGSAQGTPPGVEVRLLRTESSPGKVTGRFVANIGGQWLPVTVDTSGLPGGNDLMQ